MRSYLLSFYLSKVCSFVSGSHDRNPSCSQVLPQKFNLLTINFYPLKELELVVLLKELIWVFCRITGHLV